MVTGGFRETTSDMHFGGSKQPVRQLSNNSERQSADLMTCSYSPSFHQCMCMKKKYSWIIPEFVYMYERWQRRHRSIMMIVLYFPLRVVDYLEAFTLPERQIGGRSGLIVIQCHKGRHTSCQEKKFGYYQTHTVPTVKTTHTTKH